MRLLFAFCLTLLAAGSVRAGTVTPELFDIPGGSFVMGDAAGEADETPRDVTVAPFRIMRTEVTNAAFAAFVAATGHVTDREREGWGWVWTGRWRRFPGADWRHPNGAESTVRGLDNHPVVQVSANDARAFCEFHGLRLPGEAEWEFAARGDDGRRWPWGDEAPVQPAPPDPAAAFANYGTDDCCAASDGDGHVFTAPVASYPLGVSPFGLQDMAGNVWEWTADRHPENPEWLAIRGGGWGNDPWCLRTSYRHGNRPEYGLNMVGFRCAGEAR